MDGFPIPIILIAVPLIAAFSIFVLPWIWREDRKRREARLEERSKS